MADVKVSALPVASALDGTEIVPVVQASTSKQTTLAEVRALDPEAVSVGDETMSRRGSGSTVPTTSGTLYLSFFTAKRSETKTKLGVYTNATAAAATPTYAAMGLYSLAANGTLTQIGVTASDTTLFSTTFTFNERTLTNGGVATVIGQRYALGLLIVSAAAMPTFYGSVNSFPPAYSLPPFMSATVTGQSALPASIAGGAYTAVNNEIYGLVRP